tara:strand:- start:154 stop:348 length:195 start_codon:yes stop_codon:yes gene_type:complete
MEKIMDTKNINSAIYTLLEVSGVTVIRAVRLKTTRDEDKNKSLGKIMFEDASGREITINVEIDR